MNTNSFSNPPTLLLELPEKGVYFFHSSEVVFLIHSFLHPWTAARSARTVTERGVQDSFTVTSLEMVKLQSNWVTMRAPDQDLLTVNSKISIFRNVSPINTIWEPKARSLCEWLRQSKCHAEHGSREAATAQPTGQKQPLSSSGLAQRWLQQE